VGGCLSENHDSLRELSLLPARIQIYECILCLAKERLAPLAPKPVPAPDTPSLQLTYTLHVNLNTL